MKVKIASVANAGDIEKERLILKVEHESDIGSYLVLQGRTEEDSVWSDAQPNAFWFPDKSVKIGDLVVLYTREGAEGTKDIGNGHTSYFHYWNLKQPVWTKGHTPVLIEAGDWQFGTAIK